MAFNESQHAFLSAEPPSLPAGDHEMRDGYAAQDAPQPSPNQDTYLTPYLGLRARLSQIWINRWTILLLLVLVRTLIACASLDDGISNARTQALSACSGVESMGSAMASMPHYLSTGVNQLAAEGVEKAVNGLMDMLQLTVTGVEGIVVFAINLLTSTYLCLITLAVSGSLHVSLDLIEEVTGFLNQTLAAIGSDIESGISGFQNDLNSLSSVLDNIPSFLGSSAKIPTLDLSTQLAALNHVQLPSSLTADLQSLNASIPTFSQVNNFTDNAIRWPFEQVKQLISNSTGNYTVNYTMFPVPEKQQLTFCSDNNGINDFFDELVSIANLARKIFIVVLLAIAVLACAPMAWLAIRRWRSMQERAQVIQTASYDPLDAVYMASRPYTSAAGRTAANVFKSSRRQILTRWVVAYGTSPEALYVLSLGIAGLFACLCQYILLKSIEKEVPALSNQVDAFAEKVVSSLTNASEQWSYGTNNMINITNQRINSDVFGWVNTTTHGLNDTLNVFVDGMTSVLNETFGGTILYDPITEVFNCLIGLKIAGIERALTWVSDNAYVEFPMFPNNMFSAGAAASIGSSSSPSDSFLADSQSDASNEITAAVVSLTTKLQNEIRTEAIISMSIIFIWLFIVLIGFIRAMMLFFDKNRAIRENYEMHPAWPLKDTDVRKSANVDVASVQSKPEESRAPSYERAVANSGNQYNGTAYTLDPRPFPTVQVTSPPEDPHEVARRNEKIGYAGARAVDTVMNHPAHQRKSSHADLNMTTPAVGGSQKGTFQQIRF